ncbi:MAG: sugar ABC transporter ATP-binding protein [Actinomycetota bacterium]
MSDQTPPRKPLLELAGISKSFFGVQVLQEVGLDLGRGEVHAVVGENGAGKSTLMKIVAGAYRQDSGDVRVDGEVLSFHSVREAQHHGIGIIFQEFTLLPERTVAQNIFLGREPLQGISVDRRAMEMKTRELLSSLGVEGISPRAVVGTLSVAQQQIVEIAKALSLDPRILVMDEPTAALSPHEVDALLDRVRLLQERGLGVLYITHRLKEVFSIADRITVLKDGRRIDTVPATEVTTGDLVRMMVGRELEHYFPPRAEPEAVGEVRLRVTGGGTEMLHDINLEVRAGEIVGLAGLQGSGRTEVARALFGAIPFDRGTVEIERKPTKVRSPRDAMSRSVGFLTEDRKSEGLVLPHSIRNNALLALRALRPSRRRALNSKGAVSVDDLSKRVDVRAASLEQEVRYLSGGNQQKVVLAKWLATRPDVLIFDEPTRGIDVGAKAGIHELMRELANRGVAILMISSELPEVIGMSDRIVVMRNGTVAGELPAGSSEQSILLLAATDTELEAG